MGRSHRTESGGIDGRKSQEIISPMDGLHPRSAFARGMILFGSEAWILKPWETKQNNRLMDSFQNRPGH